MSEIQKLRRKIDACDKKAARLFSKRMAIVRKIAEIKKDGDLAVCDPSREEKMISKNSNLVSAEIREYYTDFLKCCISLSKKYQRALLGKTEINISRGSLLRINDYYTFDKKVLIVTDSGVPEEYVTAVKSQIKNAFVFKFLSGEESKSIDTLTKIISALKDGKFTRSDCVLALGGGVVGDIAGFAAGIYMRGIDWVYIPTTTLSQTDASVGGKTAADFDTVKNNIGVFYKPKAVIIDTATLETLPEKVYNCGLVEALKTGAVLDSELFSLFESGDIRENIDLIVERAVTAKQKIVTADFTENGIRRCLNFGHTVGHAVESVRKGLSHGECVAFGMLFTSSLKVQKRLCAVYEKLGIKTPDLTESEISEIKQKISFDKKIKDGKLIAVFCENIGEYELREIKPDEFFREVKL